MNGNDIIREVAEFVGALSNYPSQLAGCLALWLALLWLTRANRVSAFALSFSAWFAVGWMFIIGFFVRSGALERLDPYLVGTLLVMALPMVLFGFCTVSSLASFNLVRTIEEESPRAIRLLSVLLVAHVVHFVLIAMLTALSTP